MTRILVGPGRPEGRQLLSAASNSCTQGRGFLFIYLLSALTSECAFASVGFKEQSFSVDFT